MTEDDEKRDLAKSAEKYATDKGLPTRDRALLNSALLMDDRWLRREIRRLFHDDLQYNEPMAGWIGNSGMGRAAPYGAGFCGLVMTVMAFCAKGGADFEKCLRMDELTNRYTYLLSPECRETSDRAGRLYIERRDLIRAADDAASQTLGELFPDKSQRPRYGTMLADLLTTGPFTTAQLAKRQAAIGGWQQRLECHFQKVEFLNAGELKRVRAHWEKATPGGLTEKWQPGQYLTPVFFPKETFADVLGPTTMGNIQRRWAWWDRYMPMFLKSKVPPPAFLLPEEQDSQA
ncbi:hypothetical protein ACIQWA_03935 [Kitasatospora sp. NPDC098652]|uniref:hypothetical protein n=1 Tax=Kitasatospora sp. NPDC098652 TaxID=3364095 RepID=UPI0037FEE2A8